MRMYKIDVARLKLLMKIQTFKRGSGMRFRIAVLAVTTVAATMNLGACSKSVSNAPVEAYLDTQATQIGGATTAVSYYQDSGSVEWTLYSMANRFAATPIAAVKGAITEVTAPGYIEHITVVSYNGQDYALLAMGKNGIGVVNISNPAAMVYTRTITVDYDSPSYTYVDGGGNQFTADPAAHTDGTVNFLLVDDNGSPTNYADDQLYIANGDFGIQKTLLSNLMDATADGALPVSVFSDQVWTLKYAGENPWGGPLSLTMHGGKLYAALGFLGIGIYDPVTLVRENFYNLYTDCNTREDRFGYQNAKPCDPGVLNVDPAIGLDADGMLTYAEAAYELANKNTVTSYPWAAFDRYGKYYYNARKVEVVDLPGARTMAYIAYSLGGLVAVDVTTTPTYEGYVAPPPAHGPDDPTGAQSKSILSHYGAGMLEEAGVADVHVVPDSNGTSYKAYFTDHFAGLVVVSGAENPASQWHNPGAPYNNDTLPQAYWPDYEYVTSYDMTPVPVGEESLPAFLVADASGNYASPLLLATGEISGHGGAMFLMPCMQTATCTAGNVNVVEASGAGGVSYVEIKNLGPNVAVADRFAVPVHMASTNEIGAAPPGMPTDVAIGHTEGVTVRGRFLYLADGPHGMSVWPIADAAGTPTDDLHLVANTLMDEYPVDTYLPAPHAAKVNFGSDPNKAYVMSQSLGMRRVDVSPAATAQVGTPALLNLATTDIYEHTTEAYGNLGGINSQDHAYYATFYGKYALVADGGNGLTVYDTSVPADPVTGTHVVANIGSTTTGKPPLGRATSVALWKHSGRIYAVVAAGPYGVSVVDMTDLLVNGLTPGMTLIKTFEPIKLEEEAGAVKVGKADGKSVDVKVINDYAYVSYDSFGLVAYKMTDLIKPISEVDPMCTDPTKLFDPQTGLDCRPTAVARYKLQADPLHPEFASLSGGAQYMTAQVFPAPLGLQRLLFYVAYAGAGVIKLDWSDPTNPILLQHHDTVGKAVDTAIANGRVYVADYGGGLVVFKK